MPIGIRESDSTIIKRSLSNLELKVTAQNSEISALKEEITALTTTIKKLCEGGIKTKCDKCDSSYATSIEKTATGKPSASETKAQKLPTAPQRQKETKNNQTKNVNKIQTTKTNNVFKSNGKNTKSPARKVNEIQGINESEVEIVQHENKNNNWTLVANRKRRYQKRRTDQITRGDGETSEILCAAERTRYLHVWGARPETTEDNMIAYLNGKNISSSYSAVKLSTKRLTNYASFKIGVPEELADECISPQFWPKGLSAERWLFRLERTKSDPERKSN
ncbi:hypothetical protein O0L34_g18615 [Tuta absoluta]|nr:hypothetical protein O0L34_g18615 [Tuta absoluta]